MLQDDVWTKNTSGCLCYFDNSRSDCACCQPGGCQCPDTNLHQCVQCGYGSFCGIREYTNNSQYFTCSNCYCMCPLCLSYAVFSLPQLFTNKCVVSKGLYFEIEGEVDLDLDLEFCFSSHLCQICLIRD